MLDRIYRRVAILRLCGIAAAATMGMRRIEIRTVGLTFARRVG
jgi:hypothetical protein